MLHKLTQCALQEKSYSITSNKTLAYPMMANHDVNSSRRENPHKYILYKPTITQIMMFLATGLSTNFISGYI